MGPDLGIDIFRALGVSGLHRPCFGEIIAGIFPAGDLTFR
jgi:hypothetical protein